MKIKNKTVKKAIDTEKDLEIYQDTKFEKDIKCRNIICVGGRWNINCWNIDCHNIDCNNINCWNINCWNINCHNIDCNNINCYNIACWNIDCHNIDCWDIACWNIDCWNIICEKRIKKSKEAKTIAKIFIQNRSKLERKEWKE
jgi:hypothetical protein